MSAEGKLSKQSSSQTKQNKFLKLWTKINALLKTEETSSSEFGELQVIFSFSLCLWYKIFWLRLHNETLWKTLLLTFSLHWLWTVNVLHHSVERPPQMMLKIAAWRPAWNWRIFFCRVCLCCLCLNSDGHTILCFFWDTATVHWMVTLMLNVARGPLTTSTKVVSVSVSKTPQVLMQYMVF